MNKYKTVETFFQGIAHYINNKKNACIIMHKKWLKIVLSVLDAVRNGFPETNEFTDSTLTKECEKERITVDEKRKDNCRWGN